MWVPWHCRINFDLPLALVYVIEILCIVYV